jgi:hypothetical protein
MKYSKIRSLVFGGTSASSSSPVVYRGGGGGGGGAAAITLYIVIVLDLLAAAGCLRKDGQKLQRLGGAGTGIGMRVRRRGVRSASPRCCSTPKVLPRGCRAAAARPGEGGHHGV